MKIITTNIWRYYEWEKRKDVAINFFKEQDADVIFLQEVGRDERLNEKWSNQVEEINEKLNYSSTTYKDLTKMEKWHGKPIDWEMYYGFGILSKFPIKLSERIILPHIVKDKDFGFLHAVLETPSGDVDLINVHLENTDEGSKAQLKFILEWCNERKIKPIIAGDFNMKIIENLKGLAEAKYHISYLIKEYISFMPTNFSHNDKPITLDYIIAHKEKFSMKNIDCINNTISDHNPVIAEIELQTP